MQAIVFSEQNKHDKKTAYYLEVVFFFLIKNLCNTFPKPTTLSKNTGKSRISPVTTVRAPTNAQIPLTIQF